MASVLLLTLLYLTHMFISLSQPRPFSHMQVRTWIGSMRDNGEAFYAGSTYLLAGVLFRKDPQLQAAADHAAGLSSNGNGNGHSNGNGNGHSTANGGGQAHAAEEAGQADLSDSLAMVLTSLQ